MRKVLVFFLAVIVVSSCKEQSPFEGYSKSKKRIFIINYKPSGSPIRKLGKVTILQPISNIRPLTIRYFSQAEENLNWKSLFIPGLSKIVL
jgi:hypothetical protein